MSKTKNIDEVYTQCIRDGILQEPEESDIETAKSLLENAELDLKSLKASMPVIEETGNFGLLWSIYYEAIRRLAQGILLLDKVTSENHQCMYAYICVKHKEWDIDWETIETMRLFRNAVHYEGRPVTEQKWKEYKLKFEVYSRTFSRLLKEKLKENQ